eukprot:scaffold96075_cov63-Phaeocystis_antarctica.AAC.3
MRGAAQKGHRPCVSGGQCEPAVAREGGTLTMLRCRQRIAHRYPRGDLAPAGALWPYRLERGLKA